MTYVVIKVIQPYRFKGCQILSKRSENRAEMEEYKKEIQKRYPNDQVAVMTLEKAKANRRRYAKWFAEYEEKVWDAKYTKIMRDAKKDEIMRDYWTCGCVSEFGKVKESSWGVAIAAFVDYQSSRQWR